MAIKNLYKVPQAQWRKWKDEEKQLFNDVYSYMYDNQELFLHPKQKAIDHLHWKTIAWNSAWIAADYLKYQRIGLV